MTDQEVELIRRHAETMACIVVEMYQEQLSDFRVATVPRETHLARAGEWI